MQTHVLLVSLIAVTVLVLNHQLSVLHLLAQLRSQLSVMMVLVLLIPINVQHQLVVHMTHHKDVLVLVTAFRVLQNVHVILVAPLHVKTVLVLKMLPNVKLQMVVYSVNYVVPMVPVSAIKHYVSPLVILVLLTHVHPVRHSVAHPVFVLFHHPLVQS
jgi:hypothetical protein